jgi:predicted house-cleaning NTP pyrophosphatase (Maf/HAM1 superfamily)
MNIQAGILVRRKEECLYKDIRIKNVDQRTFKKEYWSKEATEKNAGVKLSNTGGILIKSITISW